MEQQRIGNDALDYLMRLLLQSGLAAAGGWVSAIVVGFPLSTIFPRFADYAVMSPTFLIPIVSGIGLAVFLNRRGWETSHFSFIPSIALPVAGYFELLRSPFRQHSPWVDLAGIHCGETECLYELLFAVPCAAALGYSFASFFLRSKHSEQSPGKN